MMNLSMSHNLSTYGDSFTVTCYVCGMPSSKEWAQKARSRPTTPMKPYFPFLLQITPVGGAILREDGSTYLCAFCHALLETQWFVYESQQVVPPPNRKYNIQKFICAVCGVETYRKRIRALPFQEFPFLEKQRQPGSITLGNNPLAVVCLDCSETLWAQSAEYDRWGLPVQKRHFNWMARPPPPEDSVEATVARLPSGETQLPRCPPIEPSIPPPKTHEASPGVKILDTTISSKGRSKGKRDSPKLENPHSISSPTPQAGRKTSLTSITPPALDMVSGFHNQQPPVVTVAPMSSHTTVISLRKDSLGMPPGMIAPLQSTSSGRIYPQSATAVYPSAAPYPYVWGSTAAAREASQRSIETYPYGPAAAAPEAIHGQPGTWSWLSHPTTDLMRYQSYVSSLQSRSIGESTVSRSPTHSAGSPTVTYGSSESPSRYASASNISVTSQHLDRERNPQDEQRSCASTSTRRPHIASGGSSDELPYPNKSSPDPKAGMKSPRSNSSEKPCSSTRQFPAHHRKPSRESEVNTAISQEQSTEAVSKQRESPPLRSSQLPPMDDDELDKSNRRELHIPKKRNWHVFMKDSQSVTPTEEKKVSELPPHPKKKKFSIATSEPHLELSKKLEVAAGTSKDDSSFKYSTTNEGSKKIPIVQPESRARSLTVSAMDLSATASTSVASGKSSKGAGANFMIEYLCQSEASKQGELQHDDTVSRTSVIKCAPKVPHVIAEETSQKSISEETTPPSPVTENKNCKDLDTSSSNDEAIVKEKSDDTSRKPVVGDVSKRVEKIDDNGDDTGGKEGNKDVEKGNSERQLQDSTMHSDDDETKNEDLPNIEQFIKETVLELVNREKEESKLKKEEVHQQKQFLNELGLVTPEKKIELEIKSIVSRHDRKTLPPLKLRVESKHGRKIDKRLKELLLKVSLEDPSLFQEKPESEKCDFMAELGMKTAKKSEKTKREIKWRVVLMERMRRELRDAAARGVKHEWEKSEILKRFADCDLDSFFGSLSFASLLSSEEETEKEKVIDGASSSISHDLKTENVGNKVCINYPKYIPSYVVTGPSTTNDEITVKTEEDDDKSGSSSTVKSSEIKECLAEPILKIPVIPSKRRLQSESSVTTATSDTDDSSDLSNLEQNSTGVPSSFSIDVSTDAYPLRIDNLIQCSATYWEQMKRGIDDILNDLDSSKEDISSEEKNIQIGKIRKHLKSQLSDIKNIEKRLRATGKNVLNASRRKSLKKE